MEEKKLEKDGKPVLSGELEILFAVCRILGGMKSLQCIPGCTPLLLGGCPPPVLQLLPVAWRGVAWHGSLP